MAATVDLSHAASHGTHVRMLLGLGLPLVGSQLAHFAIGMTDTLMLGRYSVEALAAGTMATTVFIVALLVGSGLAHAVGALVPEAVARGDHRSARRVVRMGLWSSACYGAVLTPVLVAGEPLLRLIGQPEPVAEAAGAYLRIAAWGLVPALLGRVLHAHLAALGRGRIVLVATLASVVVNAGLNWLLIFGSLGAPELGVRGAAIASLGVHLAALVVLAAAASRALPGAPLFTRLWRVDRVALARVVRLGWPIGFTSLAEASLFAASTVMMGWLGTVPLAAHGVALQFANLAFMFHVGLSQAATVRAGTAFGLRDAPGLARGGVVAVALSLAIAFVGAMVFVAVPEPLVSLFVSRDEPQRDAILAAGATLMLLAAAFQMADAAQVMALGLLRGVQDTAVPMVIAAVAYWAIGIPAAYLLGFVLGLGGPGVWGGLVLGLLAAALLLMLRFWGPMRRRLHEPAW